MASSALDPKRDGMELISRKDAMSLGLPMYFTGKPCIRGGVAERRVNGKACTCPACMDLRSDKATAKYREDPAAGIAKALDYQRRNPERVKEKSKEWRDANVEHRANLKSAWYLKNRETELQKVKGHYLQNRETILQKKSHRDLQGRKLLSEKQKAWRQKNPHVMILHYYKRKLAELERMPGWFGELDAFVISEARHLCKLRSLHVGGRWVIDHCIPLLGREVSGLHCWNNLQVIPSDINSKKHNRLMLTEPFEWMSLLH
jgi:hypothetical protein